MGGCGSKTDVAAHDEEMKNRQVERELVQDQKDNERLIKVLLLGAGDSGKSTIFKQIGRLYKIEQVQSMQNDIAPLIVEHIGKELAEVACLLPDDSEEHRTGAVVLERPMAPMHIRIEQVRLMWASPQVQERLRANPSITLNHSLEYFMAKIDEIGNPGYAPSFEDFLRCRVRTTGVQEFTFQTQGPRFSITDVGGQRGERRKWINCFSNVNAVLFVSAISGYDETLFEERTVERVKEDLRVFQEVSSYDWIQRAALVLFLNKRDLFDEKFRRVPLSQFFPDFNGSTPEDGYEFFKQLFVANNGLPQHKVYIHVTCALDTDLFARLFDSVKDSILNEVMRLNGLV